MQSELAEMKSASSPITIKYSFLHLLSIILYFLSNTAKSNCFQSIIQLPSSGLSRNSNKQKTVVLDIDKFGAKGDGITDDSKILQDVWKVACSMSSSPAKIVIPSGNSYLVNPTNLGWPCKSHVTLSISGTIAAPREPAVWDAFDALKWLYFHDVNDLTVEGGGVINGTLLMVNSQKNHLVFTNCRHVAASRIRVIAPSDSPNTDGVHISESTHVKLKDSTIAAEDDCVSIVSNSTRISINNVICGPGHGISIGSLGKSKSSATVHVIVVDGVTMFDTENRVRIKTWQGGSGYARKIIFQNIKMRNVSNPIIIDQYYCDSPSPCANQTSAVSIDSISFRNIKGTSATEEAITLSCRYSHPCKKLYLEDIELVSLSGPAKSFYWKAYGTSSGLIHPPSCLSSSETIFLPNIKSEPTRVQSDDDRASI
ncbi:hypothetical protein SASPL_118778 [Salvia splendens]|uniref:Polygalacturonase n=1 Tax=Salvia splendens TaxID=180675 RepID=A0A8X8XXY8_SALSN|nr:hypothetical protein SASPL_118778 [Salvia splendens]